jgi:DNA-binding IclR family transcriptional regulator
MTTVEPETSPEAGRAPLVDRSTSQALDRGLQLVELIAERSDGMSVSELAAAIGFHRTIVSRLLKTLAARRYVIRDEFGRYQLGGRLLELSRFVQPRVRATALPVLRLLADRLQATTHLTMADGDEAVALVVAEPATSAYHVSYNAGARRALWRGASGVAILSTRPPDEAEHPNVALARSRGWALSEGELETGTTGIAAPLPQPQYANYSIGVVMLIRPTDPGAVARQIVAAARQITDRLI